MEGARILNELLYALSQWEVSAVIPYRYENRPVNILRIFPSVFEETTQSPISIDVLTLTRSDCSNDCYKETWLFRHLNDSMFHLREMTDSKKV